MKILTSHTIIASWLIPLRPCCVNMHEPRLFPLEKILLGKDGKWWREITWSENVLLVLFWPQHPISKQDGETISPLLLLLQVLLLLVEMQQPISSAPECRHLMNNIRPSCFFFRPVDLTSIAEIASLVNQAHNPWFQIFLSAQKNISHFTTQKNGVFP